ncbi:MULTISPECIES: TIGR04211 family SH3 domain-containing protein [Photorhabdus]|uniref:SH3 domain-containing protein n=3 Tax=Photorhabdus khanii TaxID=1004150 RepID=A0A4R4JCF9_9GAMM|nr:TIGR04211 family SH3 domain-containing protein [Photorhabdus khanii]ETS33007.1 SH3 domain protein [Photorhabdus khanii NC19]MQL48110.1 SH3 domain-containing protein [Photorhabdus khanii]TDB51660.1 SH3 domain-containing protein [Photorhabdus khanii subsp. guanajuatensis]
MRKLPLLLTTLLSLSFSLTTHAEEKRYVSDELSTYTHAGPGNKYRIAGTLNAGDEVTLISINRDSNYAQVKDDKDRIVWLPINQLSDKPSLRTRLPEMEQEIKILTDKLANIDNSWNQRTADMQQNVSNSSDIIAGLKKENEHLKNKLIVAEKKLDAANLQLDDKQRNIILQWFMYGGGVAGAGLILGLLLPHMVPRRKRNDRWMS